LTGRIVWRDSFIAPDEQINILVRLFARNRIPLLRSAREAGPARANRAIVRARG